MSLHYSAFYAAILFLLGVLLGSIGASSRLVCGGAALASIVFLLIFFRKRSGVWLFWGGASILIFLGFFYYSFHAALARPNIKIGMPVRVQGMVNRYPEHRMQSQKLTISLLAPDRGELSLYTSAYPRFFYGDILEIEGVAEKESGAYVFLFPKIILRGEGNGGKVSAALFSVKAKLEEIFQAVLPQKHAALLLGLTLGEDAGFSKEFRGALAKSGTSHIVALSGYNIALIVSLVGTLFSYFLSKRASFFVTLAVILFFVVMTGGEASVVRAAIMGAIALLALHIGRIYSFRNAITFAALLMVLANPRVLIFDIGFQLSFAALLGIVYLLPALRTGMNIGEEKGFLGWRENALTTFSAQLAVVPILLKNFGVFSLSSLPANILILSVVPILTVWGYVVGFLGMVSASLAQVGSWFLYPLLSYIIAIIEFFAELDLEFSVPMPFWAAIFYYAALSAVIVIAGRKTKSASVQNENRS